MPSQRADEEASHVEPLLSLKAELLDSPDPTYWTEELIEVLLTQVVPRKVVQPREMVMAQVPALGHFFAFLGEHRRWNQAGLDVDRARQVLEQLEFAALEASDDPTARSFSGNILTYATTLGVDLESPALLEAYMQWYNTALTIEERHEISDTGRLANPSTPFDPAQWTGLGGPAGGSLFGAGPFGAGPAGAGPFGAGPAGLDGFDGPEGLDELDDLPEWPWFLPDADAAAETLLTMSEEPLGPEALVAAHGDVRLVQRAARLLEFLGEGQQVTSTGALRLADVRTLLEEWGIDSGPRALTTMWQVDEIAGPWSALVAGGWITLTRTRAYREAHPHAPYVPAAEGPGAYTNFARALMIVLLLTMAEDVQGEVGFRGGPDTITALLFAGNPDGLTLPDPQDVLADMFSGHGHSDEPMHPGPYPARLEDMWRLTEVQSDLVRLSRCGLLWQSGDIEPEEDLGDEGGRTFWGNDAVLAAVISTVEALRQSGS